MRQPGPGGTGLESRARERLHLKNPIVQVDESRNYYPTSSKLALLAQLSNNHEKVLPGTSFYHPEASVEQAKSSKKASWLSRPLPSSTRPSERSGVMTAPQARWLVPHRQGKSKEVGPRGGRRCRTTSQLAGIPPAWPGLMGAWRKRRRQADPRGRSLTAGLPGRSHAARGPSSFASTERRRLPSTAGRSPSSSRAIRRIGQKAAAPGKRPPRRRSPLPSPRRMTDLVISPRRRRRSTVRTTRASRPALPLAMKHVASLSPSRLALAGPSTTVAQTTAALPRRMTTRSTTLFAMEQHARSSWLALTGQSAKAAKRRRLPQEFPQDDRRSRQRRRGARRRGHLGSLRRQRRGP
jgi:hypothetical protein